MLAGVVITMLVGLAILSVLIERGSQGSGSGATPAAMNPSPLEPGLAGPLHGDPERETPARREGWTGD